MMKKNRKKMIRKKKLDKISEKGSNLIKQGDKLL